MANHRLKLTGRTFGQIEVLSEAGTDSRGATLWNCHCRRCGSGFVAPGHRLTQKRNPMQDCGCAYRERTADLTGQQFGNLLVLRRDGSYPSGDRGYLCRCLTCGSEKRFPASTIRAGQRGCGCRAGDPERMQEISRLGVAANIIDGVNISSANREQANANSSTGLRWVHILKRNGQDFIYAAFYIRKKRYYKGGFSSPEAAHRWALEAHRQALEQENVPKRKKTGGNAS